MIDNPWRFLVGGQTAQRNGAAVFVQYAFIALFLAVAGTVLTAVPTATHAVAQTISSVQVDGNRRVDDETVRAYVVFGPGDRYTASGANESLKALFATGLFEDVTVNRRGSVVVVTVVENPIINKVVFEGNSRVTDDVLSREVESQPRGMLTRARVQRDTERVLQIYRRLGRFGASVEPKIIDLPDNRVNLVFEIAEDEKTVIARINFIGNAGFSDAELRDVITSRQRSVFSWLSSTDVYDPDRLAADQELLRRFYLKNGYADFQVLSAVADLDRERNAFFITVTVDEGPQYAFGQIFVESNVPEIDPISLERVVLTRSGRIYNAELVEKSTEELTIALAESGYAFAQVSPRPLRDPGALTIDMTYEINEGNRAYVERINIRGNTRTLDNVIRREFDFAEGDPYNRVLVERARRRLLALRFFEQVAITTEPGGAPDRVVVNVNVVEQSTGDLSVSAGYSTSSGFLGELSITERNFLGRGQRVRAAVGLGEESQSFDFGFTEPYFLGRRMSAGFDVFGRQRDPSDDTNYSDDRFGGAVRLGIPLNENLTLGLTYTAYQREISVDPAATVSQAIRLSTGERFYSIASYSLTYSDLDNPARPRNGFRATFGQDFAGLGGDVRFVKTEATATYFHEVRPRLVTMLRLKAGAIEGFGNRSILPVDAYILGGETIRGFESGGIGPRDAATADALGGKVYVAATAELQFPIPVLPDDLGFSGALFIDAGTVYDTDVTSVVVNDSSSIRSSAGFSILWDSPFGLLRGDVGFPITKEDFDETQVFKFGAGTRF